jgi:hypothetical protein
MKLASLFTLLLLVFSNLKAQVSFGIFAGPQATSARYTVFDTVQETSMKFGFQAGAMLKIPLEGRLTFTPSIAYNLRGFEVELANVTTLPDIHAKHNVLSYHTVELSFLLQHDFSLKPGHMFIRIGPSLDFALFGEEEYTTTSNTTVKRDMKFSFNDYGHYLAAANAHIGYEMTSGFFIYAQYHYGLTSMGNRDYGPHIGNRAVGISIGKYLK